MEIIPETPQEYNRNCQPGTPAAEFFSALFGDYFKEHDAYLGLSRRDKNDRFKQEFFASIADAAYRCADFALDKVNTYFSPAPLKSQKRLKATKQAIEQAVTIHVDIDCGEKSLAKVERDLKRENPSALVMTGNGFHVYYFLDRPVPTDAIPTIIEPLNQSLIRRFEHADRQAFDASRRLRVPGTYNVKSGKAKLVELVELDSSRRFDCVELVDRFKPERGNYELEDADLRTGARFDVRGDDAQYLSMLLERGLFERHSRNRAKLLLTRHFWSQGLSKEQAANALNEWFDRNHNRYSTDWLQRRNSCVSENRLCVENWFKKAGTRKHVRPQIELSESDLDFIKSLNLSKCDTAFVMDALKFIITEQRDRIIFLDLTPKSRGSVKSHMPPPQQVT